VPSDVGGRRAVAGVRKQPLLAAAAALQAQARAGGDEAGPAEDRHQGGQKPARQPARPRPQIGAATVRTAQASGVRLRCARQQFACCVGLIRGHLHANAADHGGDEWDHADDVLIPEEDRNACRLQPHAQQMSVQGHLNTGDRHELPGHATIFAHPRAALDNTSGSGQDSTAATSRPQPKVVCSVR